GAAPVVDVSTTKIGTSLKGDALIAVPNSTDVWAALSEAPGVQMQGFDVGGSHKSQQSGYEVFGIQNQARVVSDGVDHTEGVGGTGFYEDYYANEEVSVGALGSDVEIDKAVSGIDRSVATDLGIFDNETVKVTAKPGQSNTFIGYFQQGRKQKPKRGLSTLLPPESVRAQDSMSRMYKGEWQRVISNRTFFNVNVGNFTLDWPMVVQVD